MDCFYTFSEDRGFGSYVPFFSEISDTSKARAFTWQHHGPGDLLLSVYHPQGPLLNDGCQASINWKCFIELETVVERNTKFPPLWRD